MLTVSLIQQQGGQLAGTYEGNFTNGALVLNLTEAVATFTGGDIRTVSFTFGLKNRGYHPSCDSLTVTIGLSKNGVSASQERTVTVDRTAAVYNTLTLTQGSLSSALVGTDSWGWTTTTTPSQPNLEEACPLYVRYFNLYAWNFISSTYPCQDNEVRIQFIMNNPVMAQCSSSYSKMSITGLEIFQSGPAASLTFYSGEVNTDATVSWSSNSSILIEPLEGKWLKAGTWYNITFNRKNIHNSGIMFPQIQRGGEGEIATIWRSTAQGYYSYTRILKLEFISPSLTSSSPYPCDSNTLQVQLQFNIPLLVCDDNGARRPRITLSGLSPFTSDSPVLSVSAQKASGLSYNLTGSWSTGTIVFDFQEDLDAGTRIYVNVSLFNSDDWLQTWTPGLRADTVDYFSTTAILTTPSTDVLVQPYVNSFTVTQTSSVPCDATILQIAIMTNVPLPERCKPVMRIVFGQTLGASIQVEGVTSSYVSDPVIEAAVSGSSYGTMFNLSLTNPRNPLVAGLALYPYFNTTRRFWIGANSPIPPSDPTNYVVTATSISVHAFFTSRYPCEQNTMVIALTTNQKIVKQCVGSDPTTITISASDLSSWFNLVNSVPLSQSGNVLAYANMSNVDFKISLEEDIPSTGYTFNLTVTNKVRPYSFSDYLSLTYQVPPLPLAHSSYENNVFSQRNPLDDTSTCVYQATPNPGVQNILTFRFGLLTALLTECSPILRIDIGQSLCGFSSSSDQNFNATFDSTSNSLSISPLQNVGGTREFNVSFKNPLTQQNAPGISFSLLLNGNSFFSGRRLYLCSE
eukprot:136341-Hanusia_phi.AAC.1